MTPKTTKRGISTRRLVIIASPFKAQSEMQLSDNIDYAIACVRDSVARWEAPIAGHLLYPQIFDDSDASERSLSMDLGYSWGMKADFYVFYTDRGWSPGMLEELVKCLEMKWRFKLRSLEDRPAMPPSFLPQLAMDLIRENMELNDGATNDPPTRNPREELQS